MSNKQKIVGSLCVFGCCVFFYIAGMVFSKDSLISKEEIINDKTSSVGVKMEDDVEKIPLSIYEEEKELEEELNKDIVVHIDGEVKNPGVYTLKEGSRLNELVNMCGGFSEEAQTKGVNMAQILIDEGYYYISKKGEENIYSNDNHIAVVKHSDKINLNSADSMELQSIPGIGEVKAKSIIEYRNKIGSFKKVEDLLKISGIGSKTLEKLREFVDIN